MQEVRERLNGSTLRGLGRKGYPPERIGQIVWKALAAARPRIAYEVVPQAFQNWILPQRLPKRTVDRMVAKQLGLSRQGK